MATPIKRGPLGYRIGAGADARSAGRCWICAAALQFALNVAVLLDFALNVALLGSAHETVSQRTARARRAGSKPAAAFCRVLTFAFNLIGVKGDHCTFALQPGSLSQEIWSWAKEPAPNPPAPPQDR